jgi:hypothetical protein
MRVDAHEFAGITHEQFPGAFVSVQPKQIIKVFFTEGHGVSALSRKVRRGK